MTKHTATRAPAGLATTAKAYWTCVTSTYDLDAPDLHLLAMACQHLTRAQQAAEQIEKDGCFVKDRWGVLKEHPGLSTERQSRLAALRSIRELGLSVEVPETRPPTSPRGYR